MLLIANTQLHTVDVPVWHAAYNAATFEKGMSERDAVSFADGMVRKSQGAAGTKDQAAIQRTAEGWKMFVMFFSYQNTVWNNLDEAARKLSGLNTREKLDRVLTQYSLHLLIPAVGTLLMRQALQEVEELFGIEDPDEDVSFLHKLLVAGVTEPMALLPIVRDMQSGVQALLGSGRFFDPSTPIERVEEFFISSFNGASKVVQGEDGGFLMLTANTMKIAATWMGAPYGWMISEIEKVFKE